MKLRTKMQAWRDGKTIPVAPDTSKSFFMMEHDAAAAHALKREIANLREVARKRESGSGQLALNLLDVMERNANELMAEWGFDRERVE